MMLSNLSHVNNKDGNAAFARSGQSINGNGNGNGSGAKKKRETKLKLPITHNLELDIDQKRELLQREVQSFRSSCELNAEELQFKHRLLALINKRKLLITYIRDFFKNRNTFWLNSISFTSSEIYTFVHNEAFTGKAVEYYYLADSLCFIHDTCNRNSVNSQICIQAYSQLFEEWEYHFQGQTMQSMKYVMAKAAISATPSLNAFGGSKGSNNSNIDDKEKSNNDKDQDNNQGENDGNADTQSVDSDGDKEGNDNSDDKSDEEAEAGKGKGHHDVQKRPSISIKYKNDVKSESSERTSADNNKDPNTSNSKHKLRVAPSPPQEKQSHAAIMSPDAVSSTDMSSTITTPTTTTNTSNTSNNTSNNAIKTHLYKYNNTIVYEHLRITPIPFSLDLIDVIDAVSSSLLLFYESLSLQDIAKQAYLYDVIMKLDSKLKLVYFNVLLREMTTLSDSKVKQELESIRLGVF